MHVNYKIQLSNAVLWQQMFLGHFGRLSCTLNDLHLLNLCCLLTETRGATWTATNGKSDLLLCDTIMIRPKNSLIIGLRPLRQHATVVQGLRQPGLVKLVSIHVLNALGRSWLESAERKLPKHGVYLPDI